MRWVIVAHPDDELIFAGGAILEHPEDAWTVVIATHGAATPRAVESLAAQARLRELGLQVDYRFLGHADEQWHPTGGVDPAALARQVSELGVKPGERVYTHGAPGEYGHNAHKAVHWSVAEALSPTAVVSVFSGGGRLLERIADAERLALKAQLFREVYRSQQGVWQGLAQLMQDVMREERHFAVTSSEAGDGEAAVTLADGTLAAVIETEVTRFGRDSTDCLVVGLTPALHLETLRPRIGGAVDVIDLAAAASPRPAADVRLLGEDFLAWDPGDRTYDLVLCVGVLQCVGDFEDAIDRLCRLLRPGGQLILTYEPLIEGHPDAGTARSSFDAPCFRRPVQTLLNLSRRNGAKLRVLKDFVAGLRQGRPVIWQMVRLERR